jgi:hypothetical protein
MPVFLDSQEFVLYLFSERIYFHEYLTRSSHGVYQFFRIGSLADKELQKGQPFLEGEIQPKVTNPSDHSECCQLPNILCTSTCIGCKSQGDHEFQTENDIVDSPLEHTVEFRQLRPKANGNASDDVISISEAYGFMKVAKGVDLMEAILLCFAYSIYNEDIEQKC